MARFFGAVGFVTSVETEPGIWEEQAVERELYGDVIRPGQQLEVGDKVNKDLSLNHSVSVLADDYIKEKLSAIRYVSWAGVLWSVSDIQMQSPRLVLRLGGVYNGPRPVSGASEDSAGF